MCHRKFLRVHVAPIGKLLQMALLYALASGVGIMISNVPLEHIACIWLANGIVLAYLLASPRTHWASYFAAAALANVVANLLVRVDWPFCLVLAFINFFEILTAALLLRRRLGRSPDLSQLKSFVTFVLGVGCACIASSCLAALAVHVFYNGSILATLINWFSADAFGMGIVTPVFLIMMRGEARALFQRERLFSTLLLFGLFAIAVAAVFTQSRYPLLFVLPPAMLMMASRLGHAGIAVAVPFLTIAALVFTLMGYGPASINADLSTHERVYLTQVFVCASSLMAFWMAGIEKERRRVSDALQSSVDKLEWLAAADGLTKLGNRRSFDDTLQREWSRAARANEQLSLLLVDIDHFKSFNDQHGHLAGDDCLRGVAKVIAACGQRASDHAFRYGGEEFVLLLPDTDAAGACLVAETLRVAIESQRIPHAGDGDHDYVTASIGVASMTPAEADASVVDLIAEADRQLYRAKAGGRNMAMWQGKSPRGASPLAASA